MISGGAPPPVAPTTSSLGDTPDPDFMTKFRTFLKEEYNVELDLTLGWKIPTVGGQKLDLAKLYHEVIKRNGHKVVTITKQWKQVADALQLPKSLTSASFLMRSHYERYLYDFEARHFGRQRDQAEEMAEMEEMEEMEEMAHAGVSAAMAYPQLNPHQYLHPLPYANQGYLPLIQSMQRMHHQMQYMAAAAGMTAPQFPQFAVPPQAAPAAAAAAHAAVLANAQAGAAGAPGVYIATTQAQPAAYQQPSIPTMPFVAAHHVPPTATASQTVYNQMVPNMTDVSGLAPLTVVVRLRGLR